MVTQCLTLSGTARLLVKATAPFYTPPAVYEGSRFSVSSSALTVICLFDEGHLSGCEWSLIVVTFLFVLNSVFLSHFD